MSTGSSMHAVAFAAQASAPVRTGAAPGAATSRDRSLPRGTYVLDAIVSRDFDNWSGCRRGWPGVPVVVATWAEPAAGGVLLAWRASGQGVRVGWWRRSPASSPVVAVVSAGTVWCGCRRDVCPLSGEPQISLGLPPGLADTRW